MRRPGNALALLNVAAKAGLVLVLAYFAARPDLPQFEGKAMTLRAVAFPLVALLLPALWALRGRPAPYPHLPDALLVWPAVLDAGGNALDLYRFESFDHTVHLANMLMLATAFGLLLAARGLGTPSGSDSRSGSGPSCTRSGS